MKAVAYGCLAGVLALSLSAPALAQEAKSVPLAKPLAAALDAAKLDSVGAKDPSSADVFIGALYIRGVSCSWCPRTPPPPPPNTRGPPPPPFSFFFPWFSRGGLFPPQLMERNCE